MFSTVLIAASAFAQQKTVDLPDAPTPNPALLIARVDVPAAISSSTAPFSFDVDVPGYATEGQQGNNTNPHGDKLKPAVELDANGNPIPLSRQQPQRILGFMPNYRSVSGGAVPPRPTFKGNFKIATHQAFDYSSFLFLGLTSLSAEGLDSHPALGKGVSGFYAYTWRGFLDKTDGTYLGAWLLPSILHEDTRYYAMGDGNSKIKRVLYVISRQGVARTYGGRDTPNIAGLGAKVLTQVISREYYPASASNFSTLAVKFGYSAARDVGFTMFREFFPDVAAHYRRKHQQKLMQQMQFQTAP